MQSSCASKRDVSKALPPVVGEQEKVSTRAGMSPARTGCSDRCCGRFQKRLRGDGHLTFYLVR